MTAGPVAIGNEGSDLSGWQGGKEEARMRSGSYVDELMTRANAARRAKSKPNMG